MKGDFTRNTFDPLKHFSRVLQQQGRVQVDADFNEQAAILLHYLQTFAADLIGPFGGPENDLGFALLPNAAHIANLSPQEQERLNADKDELEVLFKKLKPNTLDFIISKGRYYVGGVLCENHEYAIYSEQASHAPEGFHKPKPPCLFYLDVWERHITAVEDEQIREVGLGGADTSSRAKVEWQVKCWPTNDEEREQEPNTLTRDDVLKDWKLWVERFQPANRGLLMAQVKGGEVSSEPCIISPDARYRGAENQLYRVEIHKPGVAETATFKWSRENGSVVFPIVRASGASVTLTHLGRDPRLSLKVNDWVEFTDDDTAFNDVGGKLFQVAEIEPIDFAVTLKVADGEAVPTYDENSGKHPVLRRWDYKGDGKSKETAQGAAQLKEGALGISEEKWLTLEDGIQIQFQKGGKYRSGDYWLIPARTATGDIEWRQENGNPAALPPHGVSHYYAPLAIVTGGGGGRGRRGEGAAAEQIEDFRFQFDSLSKPVA